jgi:exodeoxyribonuclease VII small subunit
MAESTSEASTPDFEAALARLEEIVKALESGDLGLDAALELFEEGIRLSRLCHGKLEQAERRVELLLKDASGNLEAVPFETDDDD